MWHGDNWNALFDQILLLKSADDTIQNGGNWTPEISYIPSLIITGKYIVLQIYFLTFVAISSPSFDRHLSRPIKLLQFGVVTGLVPCTYRIKSNMEKTINQSQLAIDKHWRNRTFINLFVSNNNKLLECVFSFCFTLGFLWNHYYLDNTDM